MYYFMRQNLFEPLDIIEVVGPTELLEKFIWIEGQRFSEDIPRQTLLLDPSYGKRMADFFDTTIPLMSDRLLKALRRLGVRNIDSYPMTLKRPDTGEEWDNYWAVNVIGCIDAVNLEKSQYRTDSFGEPDFTKIVLNEKVVGEVDLFRLVKGPGLMVVNQKIKEALSPAGFMALMFQEVGDYDGT